MPGYLFAIDRDLHPASFEHVKALCEGLVAKGFPCVMLVFNREGKKESLREEEQNGVLICDASKSRLGKTYSFRFFYGFVRRFRPFCFIANFEISYPLIALAWILRIPCRVIWERGLSTFSDWGYASVSRRKRKTALFRKLIFRMATQVLAISQAVRDDLRQVYRVPANKMRLFHNLTKDPLAEPGVLRVDQPHARRIICPGRIWAMKGQDVLIKAIALLKPDYPDLTVQFAGGGGMRPYCKEMAGKLGLAKNCYFSGNIDHAEMFREMARAWVAVVPSRSEGFSRVVIESMAVGTPVIASCVGGIPELLTDGREGFLVPPENPEALAEKIALLLSGRDLRKKMSAQARTTFLERFDLARHLPSQVEALLRFTSFQIS
ncbi:MAG: hypothetical protein A2036_00535 [Omnitrophica bacterium GWA2_50_21]|nr:MAG: hypothetical protein A2036_00535 [Omnitrophica bacterium GWA2_50_21]